MQFLVTFKVHDAIVLEQDKALRQVIGPQVQSVMESGKVQASGFLADRRGGFFLIDIEAAEELYSLFGPEMYGTCELEVHPVIPLEKGGQLFQEWAAAGR